MWIYGQTSAIFEPCCLQYGSNFHGISTRTRITTVSTEIYHTDAGKFQFMWQYQLTQPKIYGCCTHRRSILHFYIYMANVNSTRHSIATENLFIYWTSFLTMVFLRLSSLTVLGHTTRIKSQIFVCSSIHFKSNIIRCTWMFSIQAISPFMLIKYDTLSKLDAMREIWTT